MRAIRDAGFGARRSRCRARGSSVTKWTPRRECPRPDGPAARGRERGGTGATLRTAGTVRTGARSPMRPLEQASAARRSVSETYRSSIAREVTVEEPPEGRILRLHDGCFDIGVADHRIHECRDMQRILGVIEDAAAVHRRRHRGGREGEHWHSLVKGLDDRDAEPLVFARTEKKIGDIVETRKLLVRDMSEEVHVRRSEPRDQGLQHRQVPFEAAVRADEQQPRAPVVAKSDTRGTRGSRPRTSCSGSRGRRTSRWSSRRRSSRRAASPGPGRGGRNQGRREGRQWRGTRAPRAPRRLYSESPRARSQRSMYAVSSRRPRKHSFTSSLWMPTKYSGGVMLW